MGVIAEGILRVCQGLFTPVSLGYLLSVFNKNSTLMDGRVGTLRVASEANVWGPAWRGDQHKPYLF